MNAHGSARLPVLSQTGLLSVRVQFWLCLHDEEKEKIKNKYIKKVHASLLRATNRKSIYNWVMT